MGRRKLKHQEELLAKSVAVRVSLKDYARLQQLQEQSDCHSLGELVRRILLQKKITLFHKDASLDGHLEELARIRQELKAIGVNINQITRHFHGSSQESRRTLLAEQVLVHYQKVETKVSLLLSIISQLARKW